MKITQTVARRLPSTPPVIELDVTDPEHIDTLADVIPADRHWREHFAHLRV